VSACVFYKVTHSLCFLFNWPIFPELLLVKAGSQGELLGMVAVRLVTGLMPFLLLKQMCAWDMRTVGQANSVKWTGPN